jgi:hypothetical protein
MQHPRIQYLTLAFGSDGKVREAIDRAFVGAIIYFPVNQPSVASQTDTACSDSAEWEADLIETFVAIEKSFHSAILLSRQN